MRREVPLISLAPEGIMVARKKKRAKAKAETPEPKSRAFRRGGHRPAWQGHLRLSLVCCPVALYNATTRANDISFHLLNPDTNNRIRMIPTDPDTGPVERADLVKGYEDFQERICHRHRGRAGRGQARNHAHAGDRALCRCTISIDRLFWNDPYFLVPDGNERRRCLHRDPRRDGGGGPHRAWPRRHAHARAAPGDRAARQGPSRLYAAHAR